MKPMAVFRVITMSAAFAASCVRCVSAETTIELLQLSQVELTAQKCDLARATLDRVGSNARQRTWYTLDAATRECMKDYSGALQSYIKLRSIDLGASAGMKLSKYDKKIAELRFAVTQQVADEARLTTLAEASLARDLSEVNATLAWADFQQITTPCVITTEDRYIGGINVTNFKPIRGCHLYRTTVRRAYSVRDCQVDTVKNVNTTTQEDVDSRPDGNLDPPAYDLVASISNAAASSLARFTPKIAVVAHRSSLPSYSTDAQTIIATVNDSAVAYDAATALSTVIKSCAARK